jgi:hypothetical protein
LLLVGCAAPPNASSKEGQIRGVTFTIRDIQSLDSLD